MFLALESLLDTVAPRQSSEGETHWRKRALANAVTLNGLNVLIGPGFSQWDVALMKNFTIQERVRLQFRAESFNIWNHPALQGSTRQSSLTRPARPRRATAR